MIIVDVVKYLVLFYEKKGNSTRIISQWHTLIGISIFALYIKIGINRIYEIIGILATTFLWHS